MMRIKTYDVRSLYDNEPAFAPRWGRSLEVWADGWGEPRLKLTLETAPRTWQRPRVYDLNSDITQWVKGVIAPGFFFAIAIRPMRKHR